MINLNRNPLMWLSVRGLFSLLTIALILFVSAGTLYYPEAWLFLVTLSVISMAFFIWLYKRHTSQLYNRLRPKEPDKTQRKLLVLIGFTLCSALVLSGLDRRFAWSPSAMWRYPMSVILLLFAVLIYIDVFTRNPFLSNTIEIHEKQNIITTGSYGIVRHPMYLATILACAAGMCILGSLLNVPLFLIIVLLINLRIKHEESQLLAALPEYGNYIAKVRHKLIPMFKLHVFSK